jgi:hypothetical protein
MADITSAHSRYALAGVRVLDRDGLYRCEATDGRRLVIVQGCSLPPGSPDPLLDEAPDGATETIVPTSEWKKAFQAAKHAPVGLAASPDRITLATAGLTITATPVEGRWPPVDSVLPKTGPLVQVRVDAALLAGLLQVAAALLTEERSVTLLFYGKDKPLGVMTRTSEGQYLDALIMPLS